MAVLKDREKIGRLCDVAAVFLLLLGGFYVNRYIHIKGLYMDDLYMWSCYGEQSFLEFVFPIRTSTRFRPVYWMLTYLEMMVVRNQPSLFVPVNILLNVGIAVFIYFFAMRLSKRNRSVSLIAGVMYLVSHFAYYQIAQALGLLETMSLFMALLLLALLQAYLVDGGRRRFFLANAVYFLLCFSHERYIALLPLFFLALFFRARWERETAGKGGIRKGEPARGGADAAKARKGQLCWLLPLGNLLAIVLIREWAIGTAIPAGTGGTEVTETFSLSQAFLYCLQEVQYIFGMNVGPEYLSGISWADIAPGIRRLVYLSWVPLFLITGAYLWQSARAGKWKEARFLGQNLLFLSFLALCIGCSAVTIRLEMRWIYVSYAGALLYLSYMAGEAAGLLGKWVADRAYGKAEGAGEASQDNAAKNNGRKVLQIAESREKRAYARRMGRRMSYALALLFLFYAACMLPVEKYERGHFDRIYFWENQDRMNSLAEETVLRYGVEGVLGKQVYILENSYGMSEFYAETFFKVYDPARTGQGTRIHFIHNLAELPEGSSPENSIVLREVPEHRGYEEVLGF